jgi:lysophospholipase L1-like esterase
MALKPSTRMRSTALTAACAGVTLIGVAGLTGAVGAAATPMTVHHPAAKHGQPRVVAGSRYLAFGDSVAFGFREANAIPTNKNDYSKPKTFVGYPEDVARNLGLKVANLACPGETSGSLINPKRASNGCENHFNGTKQVSNHKDYAVAHPLHVKYADKTAKNGQLATGVKFLKAHHNVRLVSLMIGANDAFLCLKKTTDGCLTEFNATLAKIGKNVTRILKAVRNAGYKGQIVIAQYYSLDYGNAIDNFQAKGLNSAMQKAAKPFHVRVAKTFAMFRSAARQAHGDTCAAELLTQLKNDPNGNRCGVHPSVAGQALIAQAVERAVKK